MIVLEIFVGVVIGGFVGLIGDEIHRTQGPIVGPWNRGKYRDIMNQAREEGRKQGRSVKFNNSRDLELK